MFTWIWEFTHIDSMRFVLFHRLLSRLTVNRWDCVRALWLVLKLSMLFCAEIHTNTMNGLHLQRQKNWSKCLAAFFESIIEIVSHIEEFKQTWKQNLAYLLSYVDILFGFLLFLFFFSLYFEKFCVKWFYFDLKNAQIWHTKKERTIEKRPKQMRQTLNTGSR